MTFQWEPCYTVFEIKQVICRNLPTSTYPTCICLPLGVTPFEFRKDFWLQKTRFPGLSCGVVCVFLCLAILVEQRLVTDTDGQTHRQTDRRTHDHGIYRASIASRGKNRILTNADLDNLICFLQRTACVQRPKSLRPCGFSRRKLADYLMTLRFMKVSS